MKVCWSLLLAGSWLLLFASGCASNVVAKHADVATTVVAKLHTQSPTVGSNKDLKKIVVEDKQQLKPAPKADKINNKSQNKENIDLQPISNAAELKMALDNIYFDFDSQALSSEARKVLVKNAEKLKRDPQTFIRIEGNCDERGSEEYNLALGEKRARVALQYLTRLGIHEKRMSYVSNGKERPEATGHDEVSWARNRRDEFVIVEK